MKTISHFWTAIAVLAGLSAGCADLSDIEKKIDSLDSRLTALETVIPALNSNIEALQVLVSGSTVNSATQTDGVWTVVLSNGETLTLTQGSIGVGNSPVMSVDKDGFWMADYGNGAVYIMNGDDKVKAIGTDGITPVFGVDESGYWTVSYDGGAAFTQIKGADGNPVSALPSSDVQDPYFDDVKLEENELKVTLRSGEVLTVPVVADFLCAIEAEGLQMFDEGESKLYNVTVKGVKSTMITAPAGWKAVLGEPADGKAVLTVTAPAAVKSTLADSGADISILAFSTGNLATISKMQVQLTDAPIVINPVANVSAGEAGEASLTFNVATADASSWKYILTKEGETAPDAAKIAAEGTAGEGTSVTIDALESSTAYILYVLPVNGEIQGAVASAKNTTLKKVITSYYALYNAGETLTIGGRSFSKETDGEAVLMETDGEITANGIYFLKEGVTASYTGTANIKNLAVIGDKEGVRSTFKGPVDAYIKLNGGGDGTGYAIFDNLIIDHTAESSQYFLTINTNEQFPLVVFNNCEIKRNAAKGFIYISNVSRSIGNLSLLNCEYNGTANADAQYILGTSTSSASYGTITIDNCIFYSKKPRTMNICASSSATFGNVVLTNNTFVNILTHNSTLFNCGTITKATVTGNLMYISPTSEITKDQSVVNSKNATITGGVIKDNIGYTGQNKSFIAIYGGSENWFEGVSEIEKLDADPFTGGTFDLENGIFVPAAAYATYGAQR